jgi:hypothetical protein
VELTKKLEQEIFQEIINKMAKMNKSLEKLLATGVVIGALGLGGCASTTPRDAGDLYLQYSNIAANTQVLKEKTKSNGNPFEYKIEDMMKAYESGFIKDFDQDFDNHYSTLSTLEDKAAALAGESLLTFPSGLNHDNVLANDCSSIGDGKYSCDIGTFKSDLLDARMGAYVGQMERIMSENWRKWSNFTEALSVSIWKTALNYALDSGSSAAPSQPSQPSLGQNNVSTSTVGDATNLGSVGSSTAGNVSAGGLLF